MSRYTYPQRRSVISAIINSSNINKQKLGRRFAYRLGFEPGPLGPDDGVDGSFEFNGLFCHFQSKLSRYDLDKDEARKYYSDIKVHKANWSIMLAGTGYKEPFIERLYKHDDICHDRIFLLTLNDFLSENHKYQSACSCVPALSNINDIIWEEFDKA